MTIVQLRSRHPRFIYDSFQSKITSEGLKITHHFQIEPDIKLHPTVTIEGVTTNQWEAIPQELRNNWIFHLGLAEIPSYWKATASPEIVIKADHLTPGQIAKWHDLLIKGMGEYFYVNNIDFTVKNFVSWSVAAKKNLVKNDFSSATIENGIKTAPFQRVSEPSSKQTKSTQNATISSKSSKYLVPVGGGKDSALTTCLLNQNQLPFDIFLLNPTPAMRQIAQIAQPQQVIIAQRTIDPQLLELNEKGYLNGHVPFSAYIAFLSRLTGLIFGHQNVAISNERSSNEGNVLFLNTKINHQYSKSYEFEQNFVQYLAKYKLIPEQLNWQTAGQATASYFSLLRPLYELQISKLFINCNKFEQYATVFRSCNRGQKTNSWCGECSKCLFTFISLYPFIAEEKLISIFGQNLFEKESLLNEAMALLGKTAAKPFECVGTHEESTIAFYLCIKKIQSTGQPLPILLQLIWDQVLKHQSDLPSRATHILSSWNPNHQLPGKIEIILKNAIAQT